MTYRELLNKLKELNLKQLNYSVIVKDDNNVIHHAKINTSLHPVFTFCDSQQGYVKYRHNNSGGDRWVSVEGWTALREAGWELGNVVSSEPGMYFSATRYGLTLQEAVSEWTELTGSCATDIGCPCCGQPHRFEEYDSNDEMIDSGPSVTSNCTF